MERISSKIAEGIPKIGRVIKPYDMVIPIGFDGAVLYHLLVHYYEKSGLAYLDNLEHIVHISSKYAESDTPKFERVLSSAQGRKIYGLDMRTKTGNLGMMLRQMLREWEDKTHNRADFSYTVMFDPNQHANLRAFEEELSDEERILWLPQKENLKGIFWQEKGVWRYNISYEFLATIPTVQQIKRLI